MPLHSAFFRFTFSSQLSLVIFSVFLIVSISSMCNCIFKASSLLFFNCLLLPVRSTTSAESNLSEISTRSGLRSLIHFYRSVNSCSFHLKSSHLLCDRSRKKCSLKILTALLISDWFNVFGSIAEIELN